MLAGDSGGRANHPTSPGIATSASTIVGDHAAQRDTETSGHDPHQSTESRANTTPSRPDTKIAEIIGGGLDDATGERLLRQLALLADVGADCRAFQECKGWRGESADYRILHLAKRGLRMRFPGPFCSS
jgi:hypothetical protein